MEVAKSSAIDRFGSLVLTPPREVSEAEADVRTQKMPQRGSETGSTLISERKERNLVTRLGDPISLFCKWIWRFMDALRRLVRSVVGPLLARSSRRLTCLPMGQAFQFGD